ncbi:MAG: amino acid permease [bacterium]|nr:amino acid permease [bacterium]
MPDIPPKRIKIETELSRDFGLVTALSIGVGTMIAAGIFTLSGLAVRNVGSAAIVSFLLAALVAAFTALTYCEFVSIHPESGEGYLYTRKTFPAPFAYLVGWALVLGYSSSCAFYLASFSSYFYEFVWNTPFLGISGITALVLLVMINMKGTKESGSFQVVITFAKIILLIWFVAGGMGSVQITDIAEKFSTDITGIGGTAAMVFITFFGFSAIAASAGEIKNPTKTIPRAIFLSMGIVTILYTFVILVIVTAGLSEYNEAAMGEVAVQYLGPIGGMVIIAGALFSMISASNASIMAGSRVAMSMSRLGHLPSSFGVVSKRTQTPVFSLAFVGAAILGFILGFRLENLAHFADTVLIMALITVNAALIVHRKKYPSIERPYRVPLVPLLPILGIAANLYLLIQIFFQHLTPAVTACICLLGGVIAFLIWKSTVPAEIAIPGEPSKVAMVKPANSESRFRILVPIANPENVSQLIELASAVAADRDGEIIALRVAKIPDQISPSRESHYVERERSILESADSIAKNKNVPLTSIVRVSHGRARAILETARERECDVIVLGWKGYTSTARRILGDVADSVVTHARSDILLFKQVEDIAPGRILLPTAGGEHARCAESYAASLAHIAGGTITVCSVLPPDSSIEELDEVNFRLSKAVERVSKINNLNVGSKLIRHKSITVGIIKEAENHDMVIIGAAGGSIYPHILFGSIPENIAKHCDKPVILVKHYHPVKELLGRVLKE